MKHFVYPFVFASITFSFIPVDHFPINNLTGNNDSMIIRHAIDGSLAEWQTDRFNEDKSVNIKYAVDNDSKNLYIAIAIVDFHTQMNVMSQHRESLNKKVPG